MKHTIIVDLDGTLANIDHRLHLIQTKPPQWNTFFELCDEDTLIIPVATLVNTMYNAGLFQIIILSSRMETVKSKTERWLSSNEVHYHHLIMREKDDFRPDHIIKKGMLLKAPNENVKDDILFILADRDSVVKMWRDLGYTCLQVAKGGF